MFRIFTIFSGLFFFLTAPIFPEPSSWSLSACLSEAMAHHPDLLVERAILDQARFQLKSSKAAYQPNVLLSGGLMDSFQGAGQSYDAGISLSQRFLPNFFLRPEVQQAQLRLDAEMVTYQLLVSSVKYSVTQAYANLIYAQETLRLSDRIAKRRDANTRLVRARYDAGVEHKGAYLRAKAQSDQAKFEQSQAQRALSIARLSLCQMMGVSLTEAKLVSPLLPNVAPLPTSPSFETWTEESATVRREKLVYDAARLGLPITESNYGLSLVGSLSLGGSGVVGSGGFSTSSSGRLGFSIPLYTGDKFSGDVGYVKASIEAQLRTLEKVQLQKRLVVEQSYSDALNAQEIVRVQDAFLLAAQTRSEIAQAQYSSGLLSYDNWDLIENDLINQQKAVISRWRDAVISVAAFENTLEKGLE